jgi:hypothetical protein
MSYASQSGRAHTDPSNPSAFGVCDRCGMWYNFRNLQWQLDWRGAALQNLRILVCCDCLDRPQEQLRAIVVAADPVPITFARVELFTYDSTEGQTDPIGQPVGLLQYGISPLQNGVAYGVPVSVLSLTSDGSMNVVATCATPHGLTTNDQVSVDGLTNSLAAGFFSVTVTNPMIFSYETAVAVPAASLLTTTSRILTALVGLPRGVTTIPQVTA